jgi:hypothetical protein
MNADAIKAELERANAESRAAEKLRRELLAMAAQKKINVYVVGP